MPLSKWNDRTRYIIKFEIDDFDSFLNNSYFSVFSAKIYNDLATIYAQDVNNEANAYLAKRLLNKALKLTRDQQVAAGVNTTKLEICIYQNLSAVNNHLEKYTESLENIKYAISKMGSGLIFCMHFVERV